MAMYGVALIGGRKGGNHVPDGIELAEAMSERVALIRKGQEFRREGESLPATTRGIK